MQLRKCPSCKDIVGAGSEDCPRCGVNFKTAKIRRTVLRTTLVIAAAWIMAHFAFRFI